MNERKLNVGVLDARDDLVGVFEPALLDRAVGFAEHELSVLARDRFLDGRPRGRLRRSTDTRGGLRMKFTADGKRRRLRQGNEQGGTHVCRSQLASPSSVGPCGDNT